MSVPHGQAPRSTRSFFIETFGCQMNENDTEIVASIMRDAGFQLGATANEADVVLLNTCAVREKAESKVSPAPTCRSSSNISSK